MDSNVAIKKSSLLTDIRSVKGTKIEVSLFTDISGSFFMLSSCIYIIYSTQRRCFIFP